MVSMQYIDIKLEEDRLAIMNLYIYIYICNELDHSVCNWTVTVGSISTELSKGYFPGIVKTHNYSLKRIIKTS